MYAWTIHFSISSLSNVSQTFLNRAINSRNKRQSRLAEKPLPVHVTFLSISPSLLLDRMPQTSQPNYICLKKRKGRYVACVITPFISKAQQHRSHCL